MIKPSFLVSPAHAALCAAWTLMPGRAFSLRPSAPGVLRVRSGTVWATVDGCRHTPDQALGDHFVRAGEALPVGSGHHLVIEAHGAHAVELSWSACVASAAAGSSRWQVAVIGPWSDLSQSLARAGRALGQLALGLAGYGEYLVAGRGRVLRRLEANQP